MPVVTRNRIKIARFVAISADLLQIGFFPLFGEGFASPLNDALDVAVCLILTLLIGWHYSFLPSFIAESVPMLDLIPTWTLAVLIATRGKQTTPAGSAATSGAPVVINTDIATDPTSRPSAQKMLPSPEGPHDSGTLADSKPSSPTQAPAD